MPKPAHIEQTPLLDSSKSSSYLWKGENSDIYKKASQSRRGITILENHFEKYHDESEAVRLIEECELKQDGKTLVKIVLASSRQKAWFSKLQTKLNEPRCQNLLKQIPIRTNFPRYQWLLCTSIYHKEFEKARLLLSCQFPLEYKTPYRNMTAIAWASHYQQWDLVETLLEQCPMEKNDIYQLYWVLYKAAAYKQWDLCLKLLQKKTPLKRRVALYYFFIGNEFTLTCLDDVLFYAAKYRQWDLCLKLLQEKPSLEWYENGYSALHYFLIDSQTDLIMACLEHDKRALDKRPSTISFACMTPEVNLETFQQLLPHIDFTLKRNQQLLCKAIQARQFEKARLLLNRPSDLFYLKEDKSAISWASHYQQWDLVEALLEQCPVKNNDFYQFYRVLFHAAKYQQWDLCLKLLQKKPSLNWRENGYFALDYFLMHNQTGLIMACLEHDKRALEHTRLGGPSAISFACTTPEVSLETFQQLLPHIDFTLKRNQQLLCKAIQAKQFDKAHLLFSNGFDLNYQIEGRTALTWAACYQQWDLVEKIFNHFSNSLKSQKQIGAVFHFAAQYERWELCKKLLELKPKEIFDKDSNYSSMYYLILNNQFTLATQFLKNNRQLFGLLKPKHYNELAILATENNSVTTEALVVLLQHSIVDYNFEISGKTALQIAFETDQMDKAKALILNYRSFNMKTLKKANTNGKLFELDFNTDILSNEKILILIASGASLKSFKNKLSMFRSVSICDTRQLEELREFNYAGSICFEPNFQIQTVKQFDFARRNGHNMKRFKPHRNFLFTSKDIEPYSLKSLGWKLEELTFHQYLHYFCPELFSTLTPYQASLVCPYTLRNKEIGNFNNEDFIEFSQSMHYLFTLKQHTIEIPSILKQHFKNIVESLSSYINLALLKHLESEFKPSEANESFFFSAYSNLLTEKREDWKEGLFSFLIRFQEDLVEADCHLYLYLVIILLKSDAASDNLRGYFALDPEERLGVCEEKLIKLEPEALILAKDDPNDNNSLPQEETSLTIKNQRYAVYTMHDILHRLNVSGEFLHPANPNALLSDNAIKASLAKKPIQQAVKEFHQTYIKNNRELVDLSSKQIDDMIEKLKFFSDELYNSSTDSGRRQFDEQRANHAQSVFLNYIQEIKTKHPLLLQEMDKLSFYLPCRDKKTSFKELYSKMTYAGCAGQLGIAIRQWLSGLKKLRETLACDTANTPYSSFLSNLPKVQPELPPEYKNSGFFLQEAFKKRLQMASIQPTACLQ